MMIGLLKSNRDYLLNALYSFRDSLNEIESALRDEDYSQLESLLNQSRSAYQSLIEN
jgi:prephenate dehydrogenase